MTEVTFLGKALKGHEGRDAIHIAVAPACAGQRLHPSQHVRISDDDGDRIAYAAAFGEVGSIGIVDPFLPHSLDEGELFYICLYPYSITSLRHVWTHPAFDEKPEPIVDRKAASEKWLREFIENADCPRYETVIAAAVNPVESWDDEHLHFVDHDAHGEIPPEFWDHVEIVTNKKIEKRAKFFSCAC